jgi:hypothetical protein
MSIKLKFDSPGWSSQAVLNDEALPDLLTLITKHKAQEAAPAPSSTATGSADAPAAGDRGIAAKQWLNQHSASEVLNLIKWDTNPDKILLMGAWHEASGKPEGWRSADMESRFSEAKEGFPANFPRDIATAIKEGLVAPVTPRTYKVSRTGWNKIGEAVAKIDVAFSMLA